MEDEWSKTFGLADRWLRIQQALNPPERAEL